MKRNNKINLIRKVPNENIGLTTEEVKERKESGLINNTKSKVSKSYGKIIVENTFTFFSCVLFIIAFIFLLCSLGVIPGANPKDFDIKTFGFLVPLVLNIIIGIIQQCRSKHILDKLSFVNKQKYIVIRNSEKVELTTDEIVADDIIHLSSGQQVPADLKIISGTVEVNESLLTGESTDVKKGKDNILLSGSYITSGSCIATAQKVGQDTYVMSVQQKVKEISKNKSQLMKNIYNIIKTMTVVLFILVIMTVVMMVVKNFANLSEEVGMIISTSGAIAIGCIPTGLVLITSVTLAVSVITLAKKNILVQELYSLENLSRIDTICFDKTGTLTDGTMNVVDSIIIDKDSDFEGYIGTFIKASTDRNQTNIALLNKYTSNDKYPVESFEAFSSDKKSSAVILKDKTTLRLGAPEYLIKGDDLKYLDIVNSKSSEGLRVLAFTKNDRLIALICLTDNIRKSAVKTLNYFNTNGVEVKIISGDNPLTVSNIAKKCGVKNSDKCINMKDVSLEEIPDIVDKYTIFGRINPEQKEAVVKALQNKGHKVGMTGDGVNDTLALKAADASISFQTATDAAKNISDVVLLDNSFDNIPDVVNQGRRVVNNIQRSAILFLSKTFMIVFMVFFAMFFPYGLEFFNVENLYIFEFVVITISGFLLSVENTKSPITESFNKAVYPRSIVSGLLLSIAVLIAQIVVSNEAVDEMVNGIPAVNMITIVSTIMITIGSLVVLVMICVPFTPYKCLVVALAIILATVLTLAYPDIFLLAKPLTINELFYQIAHPFIWKNTFALITPHIVIAIVCYTLAAIPCYIGLMWLIKYILKKDYTKKLIESITSDNK